MWFYTRLLKLLGNEPNLSTDSKGKALSKDELYTFSVDSMTFEPSSAGSYTPDHIKLLRLSQSHAPKILKQIKNYNKLSEDIQPLVRQLVTYSQPEIL